MSVPLIFAALAKAGLSLLGNAVLAKGKEVIENKLGVKIPDDPAELTPEKSAELMKLQFEHEEFLVNAALREKELELDAEAKGQTHVTDRWRSDMSSDSWLSKNIRPSTLAYWTVAITLLIILDSIPNWGLDIDEIWVDLIKYSYMTILAAYFLGRGAEKSVSMVTKMKEKLGVPRR